MEQELEFPFRRSERGIHITIDIQTVSIGNSLTPKKKGDKNRMTLENNTW